MGDNNWVVENLQNALSTWNAKLQEIFQLLLTEPEAFRGGGVWAGILEIHDALKATGLALLVLFFAAGVVRTTTTHEELRRPERAFRLFLRFVLAKALVTYGMDVLFLTTTDTQALEAREYAAQFFLDGDFGYGEEKDGIVFIIDMGSRDAQMVTSGEGIRIFTDYYIDKIWNEVRPILSEGAYYDAMSTFLTDVEYYCGEYQKYLANPEAYKSEYQKEQESRNVVLYIGISLIFAFIVAGVSVVFMRNGHNNVKPFTDGRAYLKENGVNFRVNQDAFVRTHTTRKRIVKNENNNNNSWGGGSSTFSSGGHTFGGGGGKF